MLQNVSLNVSYFLVENIDDLMESKGGKKKSSSRSFYEAPLGYITEDVRPNGGIKKYRSAAYSNVSFQLLRRSPKYCFSASEGYSILTPNNFLLLQCARKPS